MYEGSTKVMVLREAARVFKVVRDARALAAGCDPAEEDPGGVEDQARGWQRDAVVMCLVARSL